MLSMRVFGLACAVAVFVCLMAAEESSRAGRVTGIVVDEG